MWNNNILPFFKCFRIIPVYCYFVLKNNFFSPQISIRMNIFLCFFFFFVSTVKPVSSDYIKQDIFLAFQTGGCLLLHESSTESSSRSFLHYFHSAISNHRSIAISMSDESSEWMVA